MALLWLAGLALTVAGAHAPAQEKAPDFPTELAALEKEFDEAIEAYYEPYAKAKTDEERAAIRLDPEKHPAKLFISRFEDLSERAKGTETGARSLLWIAFNSEADSSDAIDSLLAAYLDSPVLAELAQFVPQGVGRRMIESDRAKEILELLAEKPKSADVRSSALYSLGEMLYQDGKKDEAVAVFRRLGKEHGGSAAAGRAEGYLFEIEHLQIGMVAPDFDAVDEKGVAWKLSDYRGKVVVLDFWGIW
ncbi:MAG: hypothetical protein ACKVXR_14465 [Planctomycetota bacterium]